MRITKGIRYRKEFQPESDFRESKDCEGFKTLLAFDAAHVDRQRVVDLSGNENEGLLRGVRVVSIKDERP
jgi:hypothetical protein